MRRPLSYGNYYNCACESSKKLRFGNSDSLTCLSFSFPCRYSEDGRPVEVMLLDHQLSSYSSVTLDLNFLMYISVTGKVRQPNLEAFLSTYYNALYEVMKEGSLEPPFTREQLFQEFRERSQAGGVFAMIFLPAVNVEPENALDLIIDNEDNVEEIIEDSKVKSIESHINDPVTCNRFLSVFDDMMEAGVIQ